MSREPSTVTIKRDSLVPLPAHYRVEVQSNGRLIAHVYGQTKHQTMKTARIIRDTLNNPLMSASQSTVRRKFLLQRLGR